jgi:hypothetical protein
MTNMGGYKSEWIEVLISASDFKTIALHMAQADREATINAFATAILAS